MEVRPHRPDSEPEPRRRRHRGGRGRPPAPPPTPWARRWRRVEPRPGRLRPMRPPRAARRAPLPQPPQPDLLLRPVPTAARDAVRPPDRPARPEQAQGRHLVRRDALYLRPPRRVGSRPEGARGRARAPAALGRVGDGGRHSPAGAAAGLTRGGPDTQAARQPDRRHGGRLGGPWRAQWG